jgi:hypothetical protein
MKNLNEEAKVESCRIFEELEEVAFLELVFEMAEVAFLELVFEMAKFAFLELWMVANYVECSP